MANKLIQLARENGVFLEFYDFKSSAEFFEVDEEVVKIRLDELMK